MTFINKLILVVFMIIMLGNVNTKKIKTKIACCCKPENGIKMSWTAWFYCSKQDGCEEDNWWSGYKTCKQKKLI